MRRHLFAVGMLMGLCAPAAAVCPTPLTGKDAAGTTQNLSTTLDVAGSCAADIVILDAAGTNKATVKPGNTAAAGDNAVVVADPNLLAAATSPIPGQANPTTTSVVIGATQTTSLPRAARNFPGCTVGTSTGSCLAANTAVTYLSVQNTSASTNIACAFGVSAVLNAVGSFMLVPNQSASWGPTTGGVPTGALNCIAANASTPLYVEWN